MTGWSILDFELCYDGLQQIIEACLCIQNQPRASVRGTYAPGADFVATVGEDWCSLQLDALIANLKEVRFADARDDERRVLLLVHHAAGYGGASDTLADVIQMALDQSVRPPA
jgi:hypothetical protein